MKATLIRDMMQDAGRQNDRAILKKLPAGTVIDDPHAYWLVRLGHAEAADDECKQAAAMTEAELQQARIHGAMAAAGIHPDDADAFKSGALTGYDKDGHWIPGPGYDAWISEHPKDQ